jgi:hypothetical protein
MLVEIHARGVNFADTERRPFGPTPLPWILGSGPPASWSKPPPTSIRCGAVDRSRLRDLPAVTAPTPNSRPVL